MNCVAKSDLPAPGEPSDQETISFWSTSLQDWVVHQLRVVELSRKNAGRQPTLLPMRLIHKRSPATMATENITNHPDSETARQQNVIEKRAHPVQRPDSTLENQSPNIDANPLPKGMAEKIETVEISTLKPSK